MKSKLHSAPHHRIFHAVFACWLALLLLFGATPKEFLHQFADHKDTQDCWQPREGISFEQPHHHCDFLSFHLLPFSAAPAFRYMARPLPPSYPVWQEALIPGIYTPPVAGQPLRGPPAC